MVAVGVPITILEILGGLAVNDKVALGILIETADYVEQGRLAAARGA